MAKHPDYEPPASDEPEMEIGPGEFELLWEKHKTSIIGGAVLLVVALVAGFGWFYTSQAARAESQTLFAEASGIEGWDAVIAKYPRSVVAGSAYLLKAQALRDAGKLDEANRTLDQMLSALPDHPLAPVAKLGLAENEAAAGKLKEAAKSLELVTDSSASSFVAPFAMLAEGELLIAQLQFKEAVRVLEKLTVDYAGSVGAQTASGQILGLKASIEATEPETAR
jgi:predicted negative regulator of RcsB-dependent stress response